MAEKINRHCNEYCSPVPRCSELVEVIPGRLWAIQANNPVQPLPYLPAITINITMTIVRSPETNRLTLFNAIRLPSDREKEMLALGAVENVVRLGCLHGKWDTWYLMRDRGNVKYWAPEGVDCAEGCDVDYVLKEGEVGVLGGVVKEIGVKETLPEVVYKVEVGGKVVLITCDAIMNISDVNWIAWWARPLFWLMGGTGTALIFWRWIMLQERKGMTKMSLKKKFLEILEWDFDVLLTAHGPPLLDNPKQALKLSVEKKFGNIQV